ncbi:helix-turn-helix domain-containing protein [Gordonia sp. QH-12]|uniref:helix-turn-helix domain-containing protein n=1 Tax=Gordonia sp. QH-12 TaxID=1437876 RepID=UPI0012E87DAB|nr:helix-turn-helix domain-containing protein [Gordonia sp. QH-12]
MADFTRIHLDETIDPSTATESSTGITSASKLLSIEQEAALRAAGSFVDQMPPIERRASTRTAQRIADLVATVLTAEEAARRLGVTPGHVQQRLRARTLFAMHVGSALRLPAFQFTESDELPGWDRIAPTIPESAHPVSVAGFMNAVHPDLTVAGEPVSPRDWLIGGGSPDHVARMIHAVFVVRNQ